MNANNVRDLFIKLNGIFKDYPIIDPINYEIIYMGSQKQLKYAIMLLEMSGIDYTVDWKEFKGIPKTYVLLLKVETIILKSKKSYA